MPPNPKMENPACELGADKASVELKDVKVGSEPHANGQRCQPDLCRSMHAKYLQEKSKIETSPWDSLKSRFLIGIISLLGLWVIVYLISSNMGFV